VLKRDKERVELVGTPALKLPTPCRLSEPTKDKKRVELKGISGLPRGKKKGVYAAP
jgi:hypothetical protein